MSSGIRHFEKVINTRDYCANCDRTGVEKVEGPRDHPVCRTCGGFVHKKMADYLTQAETVSMAFPMKMSNDNEGRTRHFRESRKRRQQFEDELRLYGFFRHQPPVYKQKVTLTRLIGPGERLWDWDSVLRGSAKELIDALAALQFFFNDSPRWIVGVAGLQDDSRRRDGPGVRIMIEKVAT